MTNVDTGSAPNLPHRRTRGRLQRPHTVASASAPPVTAAQRTVRLPLVRPDDATWRQLRALASEAARFGNRALADMYRAKIERVA